MASSYDPIDQGTSTRVFNQSQWLDLKLFYVRLSNFEAEDSAHHERLSIHHTPLYPGTFLEVNGRRSGICSESISSTLRRDRIDKKTDEVIFVCTDRIRMTGSVGFEVNDDDGNVLLSGSLDLSKGGMRKWSMNCRPVMSPFLNGRKYASLEATLPAIEVYVAGSFFGSGIILTKTLELGIRRKNQAILALDSVLENCAAGPTEGESPEESQQLIEYERFAPENDMDIDCNNNVYMRSEFMEEDEAGYDDGELNWFTAGVRVGVGLGLGICLGVGIGVGLAMQTYKAAARSFRQKLL